MQSGPFVIMLFSLSTAAVLAASYSVMHEWGLKRLKWRDVTPDNCRKYLLSRGWRDAGGSDEVRQFDKDTFRITIACTANNPATAGAVRSAIEGYSSDVRILVVVTPGAINAGVAEEMLSRQVVVTSYQNLNKLDEILFGHEIALAEHRAYEKRMLTEALDPPVPAKLLPARDESARPMAAQQGAGSAAARPMDVLVGETERVQCFFRDQGADRLLIAFNDSWRSGPGGRLQPGIDLVALGYSVVDFVTREPNWFPAEDMAALIPLLQANLGDRFSRRITFGFSQGGYGAIKYSRELAAHKTIAFSPQFSIDPRVIRNNRFANEFRPHLNIGMHLNAEDCNCPTVLVYDPYDYDDPEHISPIAREVDVATVRLPFAGHGTSRLFATPERLKRVLSACETGDFADIRLLGAELRTANPDRPMLMAYKLASKWPSTALSIVEAHRKRFSPNQQAALCYRLAVGGSATQTLRIMEGLAMDYSDDGEIQGCAALVALEAKQVFAAQRFVERARKLMPESKKWAHVESRVREIQFQVLD